MTQQCSWCHNLFDRERRSLVQVEALRRALLIDLTTPFDPAICEACYASVVGTAADFAVLTERPPLTSLGHPNLLLRP
jgi:hypothetical protein